jgi:hypothetical protein
MSRSQEHRLSTRVQFTTEAAGVWRKVRPGTAVRANVPRPYVPIVTISMPTGHWYLLDLARLPFDQSGNASGAFGMADGACRG